jgi:protein PET117
MHDGVIRDVERQQKRKTENTYRLQEQQEFTKVLRRKQQEEAASGSQEAAT